MDLLIAAHAHSLEATLVSRDRDFRHLAGVIETVNWATDLP
jgi:predicted nucleic acid-binding protein